MKLAHTLHITMHVNLLLVRTFIIYTLHLSFKVSSYTVIEMPKWMDSCWKHFEIVYTVDYAFMWTPTIYFASGCSSYQASFQILDGTWHITYLLPLSLRKSTLSLRKSNLKNPNTSSFLSRDQLLDVHLQPILIGMLHHIEFWMLSASPFLKSTGRWRQHGNTRLPDLQLKPHLTLWKRVMLSTSDSCIVLYPGSCPSQSSLFALDLTKHCSLTLYKLLTALSMIKSIMTSLWPLCTSFLPCTFQHFWEKQHKMIQLYKLTHPELAYHDLADFNFFATKIHNHSKAGMIRCSRP